jgi:pimeloyl-ACP methyl ester carboxylesterase
VRRAHRLGAAVAVATIASLVSLVAANLASGSASARSSASIAWGRCSNAMLRHAGAKCGYVSVPLDYSNPTGPHIRLAVSRLRHTGRHYQGALLVNPGGPGEPGLDTPVFMKVVLRAEKATAAANDYDWIGFDPRGVGTSRPALSCIADYFSPRRPDYVPRTHALLERWLQRSSAYAHACESRNPMQAMLLRNMTTRDLATDVDSIRQALGQQQITYYGYSYGTYLGQVYATLFPSHVRRLILDSNVDPRTVGYQANLAQDSAFNRNVNLWFGWLARHDRVFRLGSTEGAVRRLFYATESRLERRPAGGEVGPDEWVDAFLGVGYAAQDWSFLGDVFTAWVHTHSRRAAQALIGLYKSADNPGHDNTYAAYLAVECTDAQWPHKWSTWSRDNNARYLGAPLVTWANAWFNAPCIYWPAPASRPVRVNGSHIHSALLIDETLDAATPFEGSIEVRRLFPHAVLLAEPGGTTHADSLDGDRCVDRTIAAYLARGALPRRKPHAKWDKTCAPLGKPRASLATAAAASSGALAHRPLELRPSGPGKTGRL